MTLDELERHADLVANRWDEYNDSAADAAVKLARAVLVMLPVVRAAEAWLRPGCNTKGFECDGCVRCRAVHNGLLSAIDTFRRALAEGE